MHLIDFALVLLLRGPQRFCEAKRDLVLVHRWWFSSWVVDGVGFLVGKLVQQVW
jgi:hypothetical protein